MNKTAIIEALEAELANTDVYEPVDRSYDTDAEYAFEPHATKRLIDGVIDLEAIAEAILRAST